LKLKLEQKQLLYRWMTVCIAGNFYIDVLCQKRPFLRVTDGRKRCNKQIIDLILKWRCNTKLVLTATSLAGIGGKDGFLGGYKADIATCPHSISVSDQSQTVVLPSSEATGSLLATSLGDDSLPLVSK